MSSGSVLKTCQVYTSILVLNCAAADKCLWDELLYNRVGHINSRIYDSYLHQNIIRLQHSSSSLTPVRAQNLLPGLLEFTSVPGTWGGTLHLFSVTRLRAALGPEDCINGDILEV